MIHIVASNKTVEEAFNRFAQKRGITKQLAKIDVPNGADPLKFAKGRTPTAKKAFGFELHGLYLEAFRRLHGVRHTRAYIIVA